MIILICGGVDKGFDYKKMVKIARQFVTNVIIYGQNKDLLASLFSYYAKNINLTKTDNLDNAFQSAKKVASANSIVLLSPASASFDQFNNATERGNTFKKLVNNV